MPRKTALPPPSLRRTLATLGENIRLARLRRRLTTTVIAERAGMSRPTLRAIESGEPGVTLGAVASTLFALGLDHDLLKIAADDRLGRDLQDASLPQARRAPRRARASGARARE